MHKSFLFFPAFCILLFFLLYLLAAYYYPGGSQADAASIGFSFLHNYWCNLMDKYATNGEINTAQPIAYTAITILYMGLAYFFYNFSQYLPSNKSASKFIALFGTICLLTAPLIFTKAHDFFVIFAGFFGVLAIGFVFWTLWKQKAWTFLLWGGLALLMIVLNNLCYFCGDLFYLPVLQKLGFLAVLSWVFAMSLQRNKEKV